ncbi:MAG: T9SS type A sorting domain-containing protein, partial [bacterium]|nr:T9SS type A sorting domain-containing protein [bacterium]
NLGGTYNVGSNLNIAVDYNGSPSDGLYFNAGECITFTEPEDSKYWFPCYDLPSDKADEGVELYIEVRGDWEVASNGLLVDTSTPGSGRKDYHWLHEHSIAQYLIAFGARDYFQFSDTWEGMPVDYWVLPSQENTAPTSFANMTDMLDQFKLWFDDYPFKDEKYGMYVSTNFGGGMEHQTNTIMGDWVADGGDHDGIIAHELGHMWWGDNITCGTWMDIWLNEGYASYSDMLYYGYENGEAPMQARMRNWAQSYFDEDSNSRFPVYDPDYMWGATVYQKGAWVLHMMRNEMDSDTQFFNALKYYRTQHEPDIAVTAQLVDDIETSTGEDWGWFFNQWVYKAGYPEFEWSWSNTGNNEITVHVEQVQTIDDVTPVFQTHIDFGLTTSKGEETHTVWMPDEDETFVITASAPVTDVEFDPDVWLLCQEQNVTAVEMASFTATPVRNGIKLEWETEEEYGDVSYNLYREEVSGELANTKRIMLNDDPIIGESPYAFVDRSITANTKYDYWLEVIEPNSPVQNFGPASATAPVLVKAFELMQNRPNPASGITTFAFALPEAANATLSIYDIKGRKVDTVIEGNLAAGQHNVDYACALPGGIYLYRLEAGGESAIKKMVVE